MDDLWRTDEAAHASSLSDRQREEVLGELENLVASPLFRQSKRYPAFLRYVVESALRGEEELKERTIGTEVFGRVPNYDTNLDPSVRLTAAEVRKRLAQYYQQPEHTVELHINLRPGSYIPTFTWPAEAISEALGASTLSVPSAGAASARSTLTAISATLQAQEPGSDRPSAASKWVWRSSLGAGVVVLSVLSVLAGMVFFSHRRVVAAAKARDLWAPLLADDTRVALVIPDLSKADLFPHDEENARTTVISHLRNNQLVDFTDSVTMARLVSLLDKRNKSYSVLLSSEASFGDLQSGPSILIGATDNPWTMRLLQQLPYGIIRKGETMTFEIVRKPRIAETGWSVDFNRPFAQIQQDFGIVARQTDTITGRPVMIVAGLGQNGTAAGMRLLADPALAGQITAGAPPSWSGRNLEVVFRTQIINDQFGPPVIVAAEYW